MEEIDRGGKEGQRQLSSPYLGVKKVSLWGIEEI